jgi:hypothetical protein
MLSFNLNLRRHGIFVPCIDSVLVLLLLLISIPTNATMAVVVSFDDLPGNTIITGTNYVGLMWEQGNSGLSGLNGVWYTPTIQNHPSSPPLNIDNGQASTLMGIGFPSPVDMGGAYFAVQGNPSSVWATAIRIHGYYLGAETGTTTWLAPITTTPAWLDMSILTSVDRVVVEAAPGAEGVGAYGMDDLTFTYVPEPAGISLGLLGLGGLLLRRNRR